MEPAQNTLDKIQKDIFDTFGLEFNLLSVIDLTLFNQIILYFKPIITLEKDCVINDKIIKKRISYKKLNDKFLVLRSYHDGGNFALYR